MNYLHANFVYFDIHVLHFPFLIYNLCIILDSNLSDFLFSGFVFLYLLCMVSVKSVSIAILVLMSVSSLITVFCRKRETRETGLEVL